MKKRQLIINSIVTALAIYVCTFNVIRFYYDADFLFESFKIFLHIAKYPINILLWVFTLFYLWYLQPKLELSDKTPEQRAEIKRKRLEEKQEKLQKKMDEIK